MTDYFKCLTKYAYNLSIELPNNMMHFIVQYIAVILLLTFELYVIEAYVHIYLHIVHIYIPYISPYRT